MYSTAFWCLIVVYWFFWLYCVTTVTPFIERSACTARRDGLHLRKGYIVTADLTVVPYFHISSNTGYFITQPTRIEYFKHVTELIHS